MQQVSEELKMANEQLVKLKKSVTTKDKQKACKDLGFNRVTISKYLNNKGTELDTALELIQFFNACISKKRRVLAKAV